MILTLMTPTLVVLPWKKRSDDNWRVARAVLSRDKNIEQLSLKRDALAKSNVALSKTVSEQNATVKKLEHKEHVDAS